MPSLSVDQAFELGLQNQQAGRLKEAEMLYRQVLEQQRAHAGAWHCLGILAHQAGDLANAIAWIEQAIALQPDDALAYSNLAKAYRAAGRKEEALAAYQRAVQCQPDFLRAWSDLGIALAEAERFEEAVAAYREALQLHPSPPETLNNLGMALRKLSRTSEAITAYREAVRLRPNYATALYNLGNTLADEESWDEAADYYVRALQLEPNWHEAHLYLGFTRMRQHLFAGAEAEFRRVIAIQPDAAEAHLSLATLLLLLGRHEEGWGEYEWRWRTKDAPALSFPVPRWDGTTTGATLFVHAEQGFGDTLQFVRYLPLLAQASQGRILLGCPPDLVPLLRQLESGHLKVVSSCDEAESQPFDFHLPLMSLPLTLRRFEPIPMQAPYLQADTSRRTLWKSRLPADRRFKVGIAWAGNPAHKNNFRRAIDPATLSTLLRVEDISFVSLIAGPGNPIAPLPPEARVLDFGAEMRDFADLAAVVTELDLVITIDTAAAHLAGALGVPVWLLLPFTPDWRWGMDRTDTPWYPTMRLWRQHSIDDWKTVLEEVATALRELRDAHLARKS